MPDDLPVTSPPGSAGCAAAASDRGNALPVLNEVRHALERLLESGEPTIIDLQSLPMGPADQAFLDARLGRGEVEARLDALGESRVRETGVAGVWIVEHFNGDGELTGRFIEVTRIPDILRTHPDDLRDGLQLLNERLAATS